jgi:hypothetical protein
MSATATVSFFWIVPPALSQRVIVLWITAVTPSGFGNTFSESLVAGSTEWTSDEMQVGTKVHCQINAYDATVGYKTIDAQDKIVGQLGAPNVQVSIGCPSPWLKVNATLSGFIPPDGGWKSLDLNKTYILIPNATPGIWNSVPMLVGETNDNVLYYLTLSAECINGSLQLRSTTPYGFQSTTVLFADGGTLLNNTQSCEATVNDQAIFVTLTIPKQ